MTRCPRCGEPVAPEQWLANGKKHDGCLGSVTIRLRVLIKQLRDALHGCDEAFGKPGWEE